MGFQQIIISYLPALDQCCSQKFIVFSLIKTRLIFQRSTFKPFKPAPFRLIIQAVRSVSHYVVF